MARLNPEKNLINLINKFSQKNPISKFKELHKNLHQEMNNYSQKEKSKGGEYQTIISELSTLNCILDSKVDIYTAIQSEVKNRFQDLIPVKPRVRF